MRPSGYAAGAILLVALSAQALTDTERALLRKSIRSGETKSVETDLGGLDTLQLKVLDVELFPNERRIEGHARLEWTNVTKRALDVIHVRMSANGDSTTRGPWVRWDELKASVDGAPAVPVPLIKRSQTIFDVKLPKKLAPGKRVAIEGPLEGALAFVAADATSAIAMGQGPALGAKPMASGEQYGTFACGMGICTATGFAPEVPAIVGCQFDLGEGSGIGDATFGEPANVMLSVVVPADARVAATGVEVGRVPEGEDRRRFVFVMAGAREVGFVASERFVVEEATVNGVTLRSFAIDRHAEAGKEALEAAKGALVAFERAFGKYPWSFLDVAESALVGGAGGVELPGLAIGGAGFYDDATLGVGMVPGLTGGLRKEMLAFITRHEVAHQWWHAQVGSHAQQHPYLDEPLAQWSALYATRIAEGPEAAKRARDVQIALNFQAMNLFGGFDGRVARAADEFTDPMQYAALIYGKAPLFYEALAKDAGEKRLLEALRGYVKRHRFGRATPEDLRSSLLSASPRAGAMWRRWFLEAHGSEDVGKLDLMGLSGMLGSLGAPGGTSPLTGLGADAMSAEEALQLFQGFLDMMEAE